MTKNTLWVKPLVRDMYRQVFVIILFPMHSQYQTPEPQTYMDWYDDLSDFEDCEFIRRMRRKRSRLQGKMKKGSTRQKKRDVRYVVKRSSVRRDLRFENLPLGEGVYTLSGGSHCIHFEGGVVTLKKNMTRLQSRYAVESGFDEDYVVVPSHFDIIVNNLHFSWKINHSSKDPTHTLCWSDEPGNEHPFLKPKRDMVKNEECTFCYY